MKQARPHPKPKPRVKPKSGKHPDHLALVGSLPCILSGRPAECAHVRYADAKYGKEESGAGRKPSDRWVLPLAPELHRLNNGCQHDAGDERAWWSQWNIDPLAVCQQLWGKNRIQMERVIVMNMPWAPHIRAQILEIMRNQKGRK